jgi:hypothetical protein
MKKALLLLLTVLVAAVEFGTSVAGQQGQAVRRAARPIPGQYIVVLSGTDDPLAVGLQSQQLYTGRLRHVYESALRGFAIRMTAASAQALARDPRVAYVEEDGLAQLNDVQASPPWGLDRIDQRQRPLDSSYTYPPFTTQVHVHVLDTGVLPTHVEFGGRANVAGDFIDDDGDNDPNDIGNDDANIGVPDGIDCHGHGTHVAATIAGSTYGVAKNALVHGYRVLNCAGSGPISGIVAGIDAVVADGRRPAVANMSLGGSPSSALDAAVRNAITAGITFAVAAGNDGIDASLESPSRVTEAITVGATDINDSKPGFSNYGSVVDVFAPGVSILSAFIGSNTATATLSGTSMASPHVAGVAALYLAQNGNKTPQEVRDAIVAAATTGVLSNLGAGSSNRLLYSGFIPAGGGGRVNVAASANGGVATASSAWGGYPATAVNNGDRRGVGYGAGGTWSDGTGGAYPDWVQITFNGAKAIEEVDIFGAQDNHGSPVEPTPALTCGGCPIDFTVQYWTGVAWQAIPNGIVRNNTLVWRTFTFAPISTTSIRLLVERSNTGWSEVAEVEAYTGNGGPGNTAPTVSLTSPAEGASGVAPALFTLTAQAGDAEGPVAKVQFFNGATLLNEDTVSPFTFDWTNVGVGSYTLTAVAFDSGGLSTPSAPVHVTVTAGGGGGGRVNVAASANGGAASASSAWGGYPATAVNNGDRRGVPYGAGGTWSDGTGGAFPDWVQITFNGAKTIEEVDIFGAQDNHGSPVEPTPALTCGGCPIDFTVQFWTGVSWQAIPNGIVRNNTLVWRTFMFAPITTSSIRLLVERSNTGWSEVAEVEAYTGNGGPGNTAPTVSLTSPAEGASGGGAGVVHADGRRQRH